MSPKPVILVVDDDQPILILMRSILREFGFEPRVASTGAAAIEAVRQERPDLVLLDLKMPGMSGDEVIAAFREVRAEHIPILILSGEPVDPGEISRLGVAGAVQKPFDVTGLVEQIRAHVGSFRA
ncbi:MAG TPA: response regulator [Thermoanaerobaculia bacterium]|nr:response regulator [Thermoanaerobaculia bacterium]